MINHAEIHSWSDPQLDTSNAEQAVFYRCCRNCGAIQAALFGKPWELAGESQANSKLCRPHPVQLDAEGRAM